MKNKLLYFIILPVILGSLFATLTKHDRKRSKFEKFLLTDIKSINQSFDFEQNSKERMGKPEMAGLQDYYMTLDPKLKRVPHERLVEAIKRTRKVEKDYSVVSDLYEWNEVPSNMGGRVRSLMIDPNDPEGKRAWAGSVTGGLWLNENIYDTRVQWKPVSDVWENLSISCIVADPNNPNTFYVGTGEAQTAVTIYRESSTRGVGIWKSEDAGETWHLLPSTSGFNYVSDIALKGVDGESILYAGVVSGTYMGEDHMSKPSDGLFQSKDGGMTWEQVLPTIEGKDFTYSPSDIEISANGRIFVGTYRNVQGFGGGCILYSDDASNWTLIDDYNFEIENTSLSENNIPGRTILASSPSNPNYVYAIIASGGYTSENFVFYRGRFVLQSTDNGLTWNKKSLPYADNDWATLAWHALTLKVNPNDEEFILAGGLNLHKSTNGGTTWQEITSWYNFDVYYDPNNPPYLHADQHSINFKANSIDTVFFTNDGGVFYSLNINDSKPNFTERSQGLNTLQFYTGDIHPDTTKLEFVGGLQDNGTTYYFGEPIDKSLSKVSGGDGAYCFIDEEGFIVSSVYYNVYYVHIRDNSGDFQRTKYYKDLESGTFICPADYDYLNNTLIANAVSFTFDRKDQLIKLPNIDKGGFGSFVNVNTGSDVSFSNVKISTYRDQTNPDIYLGTISGELFLVENISTVPSSKNIGSSRFPTANISCIVEGRNENELLVCFSNYGVSSIWYTSDRGKTWVEKEGNLPDMPIRWALFDPYYENHVLLATEVGVWATDNIEKESVNWFPVVKNIPKVRIDMLKLREGDNKILAITHGRGLFYCDLPGSSMTNIDDIHDKTEDFGLNLYPNPSDGIVHLLFEQAVNGTVHISIYNEIGSLIKLEEFDFINDRLDLDIQSLTNGNYIINIQTNRMNVTRQIVKK